MLSVTLLLGLAALSHAGEPTGSSNNLGKTPILGWNSWNAYGCDVSEEKVLDAAQSFIDLGLKDAGYEFINIDDCWSIKSGRNSKTNRLQPDLSKFPDGINGTAAILHDQGLLMGIYSSAGTETCAGYPASLGYETIDAQTWDEWGVDYLKYDNCNVPKNWTDTCAACDLDSPNGPNGTCTGSSDGITLCNEGYDYSTSLTAKRFQDMADALSTATRTIVFSLCEWGRQDVWTWGNNFAQSWRTTGDITATWPRILAIMNINSFLMDYVNYYAHNDADMLEIGNGDLSLAEQRTHFAFWAAMKSPLLLGTDLSKLDSQLVDVIKNKYLLNFNQDLIVGTPAMPYKWGTNDMYTFNASYPAEYWAGPSSNGTMVLIFNPEDQEVSKEARWEEIPGLDSTKKYTAFNVWDGTSTGCMADGYTSAVQAHDTNVFLLSNNGC